MGRSGSTLLMGRLREHPSIIVAGQRPYEVKLLTYYVLALALMTAEADRSRSLDPDKMGAVLNRFLIGRNPFNVFTRNPEVRRYWDSRAPAILGSAFRQAIVEYYETEREVAKRRSFAIFAEKIMPDDFFYEGVRAIFPQACPLLLVRDPRDTLCSYRDFWSKDIAEAERLIGGHLVLHMRLRSLPDVLTVRYEDLVTDEARTLGRIWDHVGVPPVDLAPAPAPNSHATSKSVADSIGRWRKELNEDHKRRLNELWKEPLATLGYSPD